MKYYHQQLPLIKCLMLFPYPLNRNQFYSSWTLIWTCDTIKWIKFAFLAKHSTVNARGSTAVWVINTSPTLPATLTLLKENRMSLYLHYPHKTHQPNNKVSADLEQRVVQKQFVQSFNTVATERSINCDWTTAMGFNFRTFESKIHKHKWHLLALFFFLILS